MQQSHFSCWNDLQLLQATPSFAIKESETQTTYTHHEWKSRTLKLRPTVLAKPTCLASILPVPLSMHSGILKSTKERELGLSTAKFLFYHHLPPLFWEVKELLTWFQGERTLPETQHSTGYLYLKGNPAALGSSDLTKKRFLQEVSQMNIST